MELTYDNLLTTLTYASGSERSNEQPSAEEQLKKWETVSGYHYLLQGVYLNTEVSLQIRWLAIICFKNGIDKYWRSSKQHAISKDEKNQIRSRVFLLLHEKNNQLTVQNAHAISRIARFDFPSEWPTIFDEISKSLEEFVFKRNDLISSNNILIILNKVIKAISMVRVGRARHAMQTKAPLVLTILIKLYVKFFQLWINNLDLTTMELCYSCLKNLKRLIPEGFEQPHKNQDVSEFVSLSVDHLQGLISEHDKYSSDLLERFIKCYTKLYLNMISINPTSFLLLPCAQKLISTFLYVLELKAELIHNSNEEDDFWEILALKDFMVLKKVIAYIYKKGAITLKLKNDKTEINNIINKLTVETFTPDAILHLCDIIINWYLRLRPSDLEGWMLEPEEWSNEEDSSSWEYQIRPCAENFYQDLITYFPDIMVPFVINKISNGLMQNDSINNILTKDAILCTFQLSSVALTKNVNFDQLLTDVFIPEGLKNDLAENKILKRRICLIINEWVGVQCSASSRISIYRLLLNFLKPENSFNDVVVKLAAVQSLRFIIEDWDFQKVDFKPFLNEFVKSLINLLSNLRLTESKLYIFKTLSVLIERSNPMIDEESLSDIVCVVRDSMSIDEPIIKSALLRLLKSLTITLNEESPRIYSLSLPLIESSCTESSEYFALLSEDGFDLWLSILQYAPQSQQNNPDLLNMFKMIPNGLMNSTEILPTIISIMRSYALFSPAIYSSNISLELFQILSGYLPNMRDDSFSIFVAFMDIILLENSSDEIFVNNIVESGLVNAMMKYVLDDEKSVVLVNKILLILSRLAKSSPELFMNILTHLSIEVDSLLKVWLTHFNNNGNPRNKKINLLGLIALTSYGVTKNPVFFGGFFNDTVKKTFLFLEEVNETSQGICEAYKKDFVYEDIDDYLYMDSSIKPHGEKLRYTILLETKDSIFQTNLHDYLKTLVHTVQSQLSNEQFKQLVSSNDTYTIERLQLLL